MIYRLLNNKRGVLLTRAPEDVTEGLRLEFEGAVEGMIATINIGERVIYRDIIDGECFIEAKLLRPGSLLLCISEEDTSKVIRCDSLVIAGTFAYMDMDSFEREIPDLRCELDALNVTMSETVKRLEELTRRLEEIYDGYDIL